MQYRVPSVLMRGGASRALIFKREDLPADPELQKRIFISAMGTPDAKQIDGVGGTTSSTSKVAIIQKSERPGIDVDYTFVQVGVTEETIDTSGNCGNISSAVGPFAVDEGLVEGTEPCSEVSIYNTNTDKKFSATFKTKNGRFDPEGAYSIDGVPQKGSEIRLKYYSPAGSITGKAFPTGNLVDKISFEGLEYAYTIMDITNPYIFVAAEQLGMTGDETPATLDNSHALHVLQGIRDAVARIVGLDSQSFPKIMAVSNGGSGVDIGSITISLGKTHKTIPLTGAMCLAAASGIQGTVPNRVGGITSRSGPREFLIGHPAGAIDIGVDYAQDFMSGRVETVTCGRTARRIMEGHVYASL